MDSTKKITKKLAGTARGMGLWFTSVGNEFGQVLISVLTAQEGAGLDMMVDGLVKRYQQAGVDPPAVLYIDCGCCTEMGKTKLKTRFRGWPDLKIRLDIWHFMCRIALGCTTDAHQLYPIFVSACIFEWDVSMLRKAKRELLMSQGWPALTDDVNKHLTREELSFHCQRRTHGEETTILLFEQLLTELLSSKGNDSLGVSLLDQERMEHIWSVQKKHVKCIQDPPGVVLYTETGSLTKGGVFLKTYRCARGFSFHLHLNCFIQGTSANSLSFQIYLLEGLHRWNQDREAASLSSEPSALRSYTGEIVHCVNSNYEKLLGRKVVPTFCPPACYTSELIGVHLFQQTGQALQDMNPDSEQTAELIDGLCLEEQDEDEGFCDISEDHTIIDPETVLSPPSSTLTPWSPAVPPLSWAPHPHHSSLTPHIASHSLHHLDPQGLLSNLFPLKHLFHLSPQNQRIRVRIMMMMMMMMIERWLLTTKMCQDSNMWTGWWNICWNIRTWMNGTSNGWSMHLDQRRLPSGRFRVPKRPTHPVVESTIRCVLGASSAPAQWLVAVWWRPSSSGFALSSQAPKEKARVPCQDGL
ncbi:uncharacterized protein LOC127511105 [Ctenopharyngodon idella]|uniref:uncharacterized protein LOC127511105 n=1 Tax=Ctenopharyngodon idella TaxID=7959 RepID=UPI00222E6403|nr:uncharacterized protein LOC127511105 [Ctenopharyngodon idella]